MKISLLSDWELTFPAFRLLLEFQQAQALTKSDCLLRWLALCCSARLISIGEVWDITLSFKALKGGDSFLLFFCCLTRFCCTSCFNSLLHRACQKGFKVWVNCQGGSAIHISVSSRAPGLEQTRAGVFLFWGCGRASQDGFILNYFNQFSGPRWTRGDWMLRVETNTWNRKQLWSGAGF